ncbi:MAG TPA: protease complex subunit PrcB family protein [Allosphingosinicella sp.]|nr:protease complex subunit PrcB family protein [Allosphingosinicella sp.]
MRPVATGILALMWGALPLAAAAAAAPARAPDHQPRWRSQIERDGAQVLGSAAMAEIRSARTALLVRGPVSFPYMVRQRDGSYRPQRPAIVAAVRRPGGWVRLGAGGAPLPFDPAAGRELDRLLSGRALWAEPAAEAGCTDPSGMLVLARHQRRERVSAFPCGAAGLTGEAARIVLAGRIDDWSKVPAEQRPAGLPLARFDERTQARFRSMIGLYQERLMPIRNQAEWLGQWRRINARQDPPPLPPVDFEREMLLMAAMGPQSSGGYRVTIDKVIEQPGELLAFVRFVSPGRGCGAIAAITSPVDIVRLPASPKNVRWVVERQSADCR